MENGERMIFGTDGVRGTANVEPLTVETVVKLGRAAAAVFKQGERRHRIVIGKDTRLSGYMIEAALEAGICSMGVDVILVGPLPTPGIAFITRSLKADAGAVISASHNPYDDNGIKFFSMDGMKLPDAVEARLEALMTSAEVDTIRPTASDVGKAYRVDDAVGRYIEHVKATFPRGMALDGVRILLDTANGAAYKAAPRVFQELGADVTTINASPDGQNINAGCGSLHIEGLASLVREKGADLGVALDGDADRCLLVDETGAIVDGDRMMALLAKGMKERGELANDVLVATVMSNKGLDVACHAIGCRLERTQVGDRYVVEEMMRGGFSLGGEQSGHLIFSEHGLAGDGCVTALQVLALMERSGRPLSELAAVMTVFPQVLINLDVAIMAPLDKIPGLLAITTEIEKELGDRGRLLLRYSGTQPLLRIMIEGEDETRISEMAEKIRHHLRGHLASPDGV